MPTATTSVQERRRAQRLPVPPPHFGINLIRTSQGPLPAESVNLSEGGLCIRLRQMLDVRSVVELEVTPESAAKRRPLRCAGRVTWVVQRLDLRDAPPFFFDTGLEFVNPPASLRQWLSQHAGGPAPERRAAQPKWLEPATVRSRAYHPRLTRVPTRPDGWHLVVTVDGVPCFSEHFASEKAAEAGWTKFKRGAGKRSR